MREIFFAFIILDLQAFCKGWGAGSAGCSKLTGALDADQLHDLKTVLDAMADRLEGYNSFAGAPDGADGSVKFVYKTAETVAAADTTAAETETVKEGNVFTRLWQRIVNLFKF